MKLITLRNEARDELTVRPDDDVRDAMRRMNETGRTFLLVVDDRQLSGVVADGDIRRYLARGGSTEDRVDAAANTSPITFSSTAPMSDVRAFMARRGLEYLPLVDDGRLVALSILERAPRSSDLTAVVMSGGLGTRLAPLTDNCPKPLLPLGGKPILSHIIEHLQSQGIHHYVLSVNHLAHMIVDHYDDGSQWECFIDYVHETQRLGTGGSLSLLDPETLSDPFLCLNGDVLNDVDIGALRDTHVNNEWDATMVVRQHTYTVPYGVVDVEADGRFVQIREKPVTSLQINAGIYMLSKSTLDVVPRDQYYDLPSMFAELPAAGRSGGTYVHAGRWIDIGTATEYARAKAIFDDQEHS
jgi:dTDP-glucose pyrophosphorylase